MYKYYSKEAVYRNVSFGIGRYRVAGLFHVPAHQTVDRAACDQCGSMDGDHSPLLKEQKGIGEIENVIWDIFMCGLLGHYQKWFIIFSNFLKKSVDI